MNFPAPASLLEWFASLTGKLVHSEKLAAEREAQDAEKREAEREMRAPKRCVA